MTLSEQMQAFLDKNNGEPPESIIVSPSFLRNLNIPRVDPETHEMNLGGIKIKFIESNSLGPGEMIFCANRLRFSDIPGFNDIPTIQEEWLKSYVKLRLE